MESLGVQIAVTVVMGYVFGNIQTAFLIGKIKKIDIREHGSGNAGTTNALRTLGLKAGLCTFFGDFLKAVIPILLVRLVLFKDLPQTELLALITGFFVVIGHNYPCWLHFKGGKGIAATSGILVAFDPWAIPFAALAFFVPTIITRYVSLGSMLLSVTFWIFVLVTRWGNEYYVAIACVITCLFALNIFRHRANIQRLKSGTENKISLGSSKNKQ